MISRVVAVAAVLLGHFVRFSTPNVIGIDFGSENMKVAIVSPGAPLEIVTNFQSKRKTPTCISFYKGERLFGSDAFALMPRKPELTFSKLFRMLGKSPEHPHLLELEKHYFPFELYANESWGGTSLKHEETYYHPEELLAMMIQHARDMTKSYGGKTIKDCVLTVPSSFTQHERAALYTAASIADLKVLSLIEENTAAALNYGMDRNFDVPTTVLFYNMGSSATQVSIVNFSSYVVKEAGNKNKTVSKFDVIGKAWDSSLGGFSFDIALTELLADRFNAAWIAKLTKSKKPTEGVDVRTVTRAMTRLRLEALKLKEVLSANNEMPIKIEQLHAEVDLITKVTRAEFEDLCSSLFERLTRSVDDALAMAEIKLSDVTAVEIIGGSVRIPRVKKVLESFFRAGDLELGQHLNGDEAMALGAAFRGANLSTAFRVRKVGMQDISSFGVAVQLSDAAESPAAKGILESVVNLFSSEAKKEPTAVDAAAKTEVWSKRAALFPRKSAVPSKVKTVTFTHDRDIVCRLEYDTADSPHLPEGTDTLIAVYNISGIAKFAQENAEKGITTAPKVHLSFVLDASGIVMLSKAELTIDPPVVEVAAEQVIKPSDDESPEQQSNDASASGSDESVEKTASKSSSSDKTAAPKKEKKDTTKKEKEHAFKRTLKVAYDFEATNPPQWRDELIEQSRIRLLELETIDQKRREREAALNTLEGYMYMVKNKIVDNAEELSAVSTDSDRAAVIALCDEIEEWLYGEGRDEVVSAYVAKEVEVKSKAEPIFKRFSELTDRPEAVKKTRKQLDGIRKRTASWPETMPQITTNETEKILALVDKVEKWITEKETAQAEKTPFEDPVFYSSEIAPQMKPIATMYDRLLKKPKPVPEKVSTNSTNSTVNATNSTTDDVPVEPEKENGAEEEATAAGDEEF